jgi:hypothetical protein
MSSTLKEYTYLPFSDSKKAILSVRVGQQNQLDAQFQYGDINKRLPINNILLCLPGIKECILYTETNSSVRL